MTKIAFIGAGSTVFMKNLIGDALSMPALSGAKIALMDIDAKRLEESEIVARKMVASLGVPATVETHMDQRRALEGADFVIVAFQIGGYKPCTEWQRPTCRMSGNFAPNAQVLIAIGLTYCSMIAAGQTARISSASFHRCGTVRSPRMMPPMPKVSAMVWRRPTFFGRSKSVTVQGL